MIPGWVWTGIGGWLLLLGFVTATGLPHWVMIPIACAVFTVALFLPTRPAR